MDGGEIDHGLTAVGSDLVIAGKATEATKPGNRPLDHPAFGLDDEADLAIALGDDRNRDVVGALQLAREFAPVRSINPAMTDGGDGSQEFPEPPVQRFPVADIGGQDTGAQQTAIGIDAEVAFASG